jgi:hypothetical protein
MSGGMLSAHSLQGIDIVVSGLGRGVHGVAVQGMGGIRKAETEVVRIKGRRQDKAGGRVGEANQQGGRISPHAKINVSYLIPHEETSWSV